MQISTRLLDGTYPDYRQLIPDHYPNRLHLGKDSLLAALRRVQLLVRDNTTPVRLSMRHGRGGPQRRQSQEVGDASETVDGDFTGEDLVDRLQPVVPDRRGRGRRRATKSSSRRPTPPSRPRSGRPRTTDFRYLLMPVRVS